MSARALTRGSIVQHTRPASTEISVLGRMEVRVDGRAVDLGTPRQRSIMAALALSEGRPVDFGVLVERVWGTAAPATAVATLQRYVASLRQALAAGSADGATSVLVTSGTAYALSAADGDRDVDRFADGVARARRLLSSIPDALRPVAPVRDAAQVAAAVELLDEVLRLWRGEPYDDLGEHDSTVVAERARLHDLRTEAHELRLVALLALGRHGETLGDLTTMTALHPLHERWWALRAVALFRSGRQAEALVALGSLREMLADELGVDPSPPLQALYGDILSQAPSLTWRAAAVAGGVDATISRPSPTAPVRPPWPLIGRDAEARELTDLLADAAIGRARTVLVTGEVGVGKTRLVEEGMLAAHRAGTTIARGRCYEHAPALWPFRSVLAALPQDDGGTVDLERLSSSPDDFATWRMVVEALRATTAHAPVMVVVEDVHQAHPTVVQLLEHLVTECSLTGLSLVLTRRTDEGDDARLSRLAAAVARSGGLRLDLSPLPVDEAGELARLAGPTGADAESIAWRSGGNPCFVTALARTGGHVTGELVDVVRSRVLALEPSVQTALRFASTVEGRFDVTLLTALLEAGPDDAAAALDPALRSGLVRWDDDASAYGFAHDVVREVLCRDLPVAAVARARAVQERVRQEAHAWGEVLDRHGDGAPTLSSRAS